MNAKINDKYKSRTNEKYELWEKIGIKGWKIGTNNKDAVLAEEQAGILI